MLDGYIKTLVDGVRVWTNQRIGETFIDRMPIGAIIAWPTDTAPDGWIFCDGSSITGSAYANLRLLLDSSVVPNLTGPSNDVNYIIKYAFAIPVIPASVVYATFVDYDGAPLDVVAVAPGETPVYSGDTPVRSTTYDSETGIYTQYTFNGWSPSIGPISADTTYTAQYSTYEYREVTKYVKETSGNISASKDYILVSNGTLVGDVVISADFNPSGTNKYLNIYSGELTEEAWPINLSEFEVAGNEPTHFLSLEASDGNYLIKDKDDNGYLIAKNANGFNSKQYDVTSKDNNWLWTANSDSTGIYLQNVGQSGRMIQYNSSYDRFAPYTGTQQNGYLFYKTVSQDPVTRTRGAKSVSSTPVVTNLTRIIGKDEEEQTK